MAAFSDILLRAVRRKPLECLAGSDVIGEKSSVDVSADVKQSANATTMLGFMHGCVNPSFRRVCPVVDGYVYNWTVGRSLDVW